MAAPPTNGVDYDPYDAELIADPYPNGQADAPALCYDDPGGDRVMSGLSEKKNAPSVTESLGGAASLGSQVQSLVKPVRIWAIIGGAILVFQLYVWIRWMTGPYFERVPAGPSDPPMLMKAILITWTTVQLVGLPVGIYYFIVRPWRRERRITLDGMLLVACGLIFFQDPLLNYFNTWSTYNTWMWNRGSWVQDIPGWMSYGEPGRMMAEPLLMNAPGYATGVLLCTILGWWVMRRTKARWPNISNVGLIGVVAVWAFFFDLVMEGLWASPRHDRRRPTYPPHRHQRLTSLPGLTEHRTQVLDMITELVILYAPDILGPTPRIPPSCTAVRCSWSAASTNHRNLARRSQGSHCRTGGHLRRPLRRCSPPCHPVAVARPSGALGLVRGLAFRLVMAPEPGFG